jgi:hypothetical protein
MLQSEQAFHGHYGPRLVVDNNLPFAIVTSFSLFLLRVATSIINPDCRVACIRIVANLVNCEDNKSILLEHEGLLDRLLRMAHLDLSDTAREYAGLAHVAFEQGIILEALKKALNGDKNNKARRRAMLDRSTNVSDFGLSTKHDAENNEPLTAKVGTIYYVAPPSCRPFILICIDTSVLLVPKHSY